jgi:Ca2+-transporting ATPase
MTTQQQKTQSGAAPAIYPLDSNDDRSQTKAEPQKSQSGDKAKTAAAKVADQHFHAESAEQILNRFEVNVEQGLSRKSVQQRREQHGRNRLQKAQSRNALKILIDQFKSVVLIVLAVAAAISFAFQEWAEGIAVVCVLLINGVIGFVSEWRATRSMEALQKMGQSKTRVLRDGRESEVSAEALVPGDIILIEGGDVVPADIRLVEANNLQVNEAPLTGESVPVNKSLEAVKDDTPLAERTNMLFKGTTLTQGSGHGVVVATGTKTQLGQIAELTQSAEDQATPLEKRLDALGRRLALVTLLVAAAVAGVGLLAGQETRLMIETAIALGIAAVPEGLPIVATIALARGMWRMARRQALINRLAAVETLGATRVIFTDKTGTLTQNRMRLKKVVTATNAAEFGVDEDGGDLQVQDREHQEDDGLLQRVLEVGVLCNNASLAEGDSEKDKDLGDPTEVALLQGGKALDLTRKSLLEKYPEVREVSFNSDLMMMATYHESEDGLQVAVKGAPRAVLEVCDRLAGEDNQTLDEDTRRQWQERAEALAEDGLRVLAMADKQVANSDAEPYEELCFLGLVGLLDPPRQDVREAVEACRSAGIKVVMVTGDQPATARSIGQQVSIVDSNDAVAYHGRDLDKDPKQMSEQEQEELRKISIFARVNPEQKLHLVSLYQEAGEIVAMTGDGVNDAPALKKADIGVAMGQRGTDAAREASDMVLKDDRFESIVAAVEQGRVIFGNIRKAVLFMLCTNVAEVIAVAVASAAGAPLPLRPLQILYLNVITDVFPALALGVGKGDERVMHRPPRDPQERILTRTHWLVIAAWGVVIAACVLGAMALAMQWLGMSQTVAVTVSFITLGATKLWFVFNLRDSDSTPFDNTVVRNPFIWGSIALCSVLLLLAVYLPGLNGLLNTQDPGLTGWGLIGAMSLLPLVVGQIALAILGARKRRKG